MNTELKDFIATNRPLIEAALAEHLPFSHQRGAEQLNAALHDAVFPGGKRFRPLLTLIGAKLVGGDVQTAVPAACAIEFLHTSSLVLDDLPAMDDADLRRGRATVHLVYSESIALLAALALLNQSYALLARGGSQGQESREVTRLLAEATACIGVNGMIGGQAADLEANLSGSEALASRSLKTTALMRLTMSAGALVCGASSQELAALSTYGEGLGVAYQIRDDLLDELGDAKVIGKTVQQDSRHHRASFVRELGIEGAHQMAHSLLEAGRAAIEDGFGKAYETRLLDDAAGLLVQEIEGFRLAARTAGN